MNDNDWYYPCDGCGAHIKCKEAQRIIVEIDGSLCSCVKCPTCGKNVSVNYLTFELLRKIIEKHNIPHNVHLMSDSGWECWESEMGGIYYNESENVIVFTQNSDYSNAYRDDKNWRLLD